MWVSAEELKRIGDLAQHDDVLLSMIVEWNDTSDWGLQDQLLCKIVHYVKEMDQKEENER
jgi:hypothetical protein